MNDVTSRVAFWHIYCGIEELVTEMRFAIGNAGTEKELATLLKENERPNMMRRVTQRVDKRDATLDDLPDAVKGLIAGLLKSYDKKFATAD